MGSTLGSCCLMRCIIVNIALCEAAFAYIWLVLWIMCLRFYVHSSLHPSNVTGGLTQNIFSQAPKQLVSEWDPAYIVL